MQTAGGQDDDNQRNEHRLLTILSLFDHHVGPSYSKTQHCLEQWAMQLVEHKTGRTLHWQTMEHELATVVQHNERLKLQMHFPFLHDDEELEFLDEFEQTRYKQLFAKETARNAVIFDDCNSVYDFILWSDSSPLYRIRETRDPGGDNVVVTEIDLQLIMDCFKILSLLIEYDVVSHQGDAHDMLLFVTSLPGHAPTPHRSMIVEACLNLLVLFNRKHGWNVLSIERRTPTDFPDAENAPAGDRFVDYFEFDYLHRRNCEILQNLLFRGIPPFRFCMENGRDKYAVHSYSDHKNWSDFLHQDKFLDRAYSNNMDDADKQELMSLVSPFVLHGFFINARKQMFDVLRDCIAINDNCLHVITQYLFIDDTSHLYRQHAEHNNAYKSALFMVYLPLISELKSLHHLPMCRQLESDFLENVAFLQLCIQNWETFLIKQSADPTFLIALLFKHRQHIRLSNYGYHELLKRLIHDLRTCYDKRKHRPFAFYMRILTQSPLVTREDIADILHCRGEFENDETLLLSAVKLKRCARGYSFEHKDTEIVDWIINYELFDGNTSNMFADVLRGCHVLVCDKMLKSKKMQISNVCNAMTDCLGRRQWIRLGRKTSSSLPIASMVAVYLKQWIQKEHNKKNKRNPYRKLAKKTQRTIRRWIRKEIYSV